jgi:Domain of unknown function (DUF4260)
MKTMSLPNVLLRAEGLILLIAVLLAYGYSGGNWLLFAALLLVPDVAMIGYMVNVKVGSLAYNVVHNYTLPSILIGLGLATQQLLMVQLGLIWLAHIGMDRAIGYGLKYPTAFKDTHLQHV